MRHRPGVRRRPARCALGIGLLLALAGGARGSSAPAFDLHLYADLLEHFTVATDDVAGTRVDYAGLRRAPAWSRLVASLAAADPDALAGREERLAFWIDAYNVLAIDMVVRNRPARSIRDLGSLLFPVWKRPAGRVGGRTVSLDDIEDGILRPMGDPRIHAAIVCASTSCPSLRREPYRAEHIDAQLDDATARFLADPRKGLRVEADRLRLSRIFSWFAEDFAPAGGVVAFVRRHVGAATRAAIERLGPDPRLVYFDYDWSLNAVAARGGVAR